MLWAVNVNSGPGDPCPSTNTRSMHEPENFYLLPSVNDNFEGSILRLEELIVQMSSGYPPTLALSMDAYNQRPRRPEASSHATSGSLHRNIDVASGENAPFLSTSLSSRDRDIVVEPFQMPLASQSSLDLGEAEKRGFITGLQKSTTYDEKLQRQGSLQDLGEPDLRTLLKSIERIGKCLEEQEARLRDPERIRGEKEEAYQGRLRFYRERAGVYLQATVFIAALGASLMSFAHDSLSDLDLAHNSDGSVDFNLTPTGCDQKDFTIAVAAFQISVLYSVFATMVVLSASAALRVSWWQAIWIRVRDRHGKRALSADQTAEERVSALISQLFTAKVLMYAALLFLLFGLVSMSLCIFSDTAFGMQFLIGCVGLLFVFRYTIALMFIKPYEFIKGLLINRR